MTSWTAISRRLGERRTLIGIVLLALLVAVTGWRRVATTQTEPVAPLPPGAARESDYSLASFTLRLLDAEGSPQLTLTGTAMRHDPRRKRSEIEDPRARVFDTPSGEWLATARAGWVSDDSRIVHLEADVLLNREGEGQPPLRLETRSLDVHPQREMARTDEQVLIQQPGAEVRGRGLRVNLTRGHYQLLAEVKGRYEMPQTPSEQH